MVFLVLVKNLSYKFKAFSESRNGGHMDQAF